MRYKKSLIKTKQKLSKILNPVLINNNKIGDYLVSLDIYMLFNKLKLWKDESFGRWFPQTFNNENLKFKFHILVYHAPEKAFWSMSCDLESEQGKCLLFKHSKTL